MTTSSVGEESPVTLAPVVVASLDHRPRVGAGCAWRAGGGQLHARVGEQVSVVG
jgi:hypothetical protein